MNNYFPDSDFKFPNNFGVESDEYGGLSEVRK